MRVSLVGVSCVGTTTIGRILADRRGWPFFDLDEEIERHFGMSIERLQARFLTGYSYRKVCAVVLERIAAANPGCVIALPPSGLRDAFLRVVRRPAVSGGTEAGNTQPGGGGGLPFRREVEALARARHGDRYVSEQQARAELTRVNHEIRCPRAELAELEEGQAKLGSDLGVNGPAWCAAASGSSRS